jgi:peptide-methionine (R)-S-oxide reductase
MKSTLLIFSLLAFSLANCQNKANNSTIMTDPQHPNNPYYSKTDTAKLHVTNAEWKKVLPTDVYDVARNKDTERPFTGKYWNTEGIGTYYCAACGNPLFKSDSKFGSSCGWPSFFETIRKNSVEYVSDNSYGMSRVEVLCGRCGGHLGHIFDDGPPPTGKRFCMNSIVLDFEVDEK